MIPGPPGQESSTYHTVLPRWLSSKESTCQCRKCRFDPWVGKIPWRRLWTAAGKSLREFSKSCDSVSKTTSAIGRALSTYVTAPVMALGAAAMKSSIEFESAFTGVRKTVDASEAEFAQLEATVKRMSTEIAADTTEISNVMANAGQLGIRTDALQTEPASQWYILSSHRAYRFPGTENCGRNALPPPEHWSEKSE